MRPGERRTLFSSALCVLVCFTARVEAGSDARLPDGTEFPFWEKPLSFTRTYYVDGRSPGGDDRGPGTLERPFRTIGKAAEVLQPGERVVIAAGTYRECIRPARGGSSPDRMISYEAAAGAAVVVKASEVLRDAWQPSTQPLPGAGEGAVLIWRHGLSGALFPDAYNPFGIANVPGDWSWLDTKRVDMGPPSIPAWRPRGRRLIQSVASGKVASCRRGHTSTTAVAHEHDELRQCRRFRQIRGEWKRTLAVAPLLGARSEWA